MKVHVGKFDKANNIILIIFWTDQKRYIIRLERNFKTSLLITKTLLTFCLVLYLESSCWRVVKVDLNPIVSYNL